MDQFHPPQHMLKPDFGGALKERLDGLDQLGRELSGAFAELAARLQAQGDAIQALISASPNLDKVHESLLSSMDLAADHIGPKGLPLFQQELSHIQALILAEQARRRAV